MISAQAERSLRAALNKEEKMQRNNKILPSNDGFFDSVTAEWRDRALTWAAKVGAGLRLAPDVLPFAAAMMDTALSSTNVEARYIHCMAVSTLYTATKVLSEAEEIPPLSAFVDQVECAFSVQELVRMERVLLQLLNWNLNFITPYTFVELMLCAKFDVTVRSLVLKSLRPLMEFISCNHALLITYKPSVLAYAALSLFVSASSPPDQWIEYEEEIVKILDICPEKAKACKEYMLQLLAKNSKALSSVVLLVTSDSALPRLSRKRRRHRSRLWSQCFESSEKSATDQCRDDEDVLKSLNYLYADVSA